VTGILQLGGTILSTSSFDPWMEPEGVERVRAAQASDPLDAVIAIGGEHTMMITRRLHEELGIDVVGVPKTIDNDVVGTDYTFGFDTAVQIATDAIDRLRTTPESHDRVHGRGGHGPQRRLDRHLRGHRGGADAIVIPELTLTVEEMCAAIAHRHERGKNFSVIVVSEGAELAFASGERRVIGSRRPTTTATRCSAASARRSPPSSSSAPASTRA
jgi:6-phosphofructokinase 1